MSITLTRKSLTLEKNRPCQHNWTIEITAESDDPELDSRIFVFHAAEDDDPIQGDMFSNVASLQDMNIIPADAPTTLENEDGTENLIPFYRLSKVTFDCYTADEAERIWRVVKLDTQNLLREYKAARNMQNEEVVTYE